ncbi:putative AraC-family transcriptional regulator [Actinoplanes missouriensis 431]|uniref:Putative AraC-family transcriptional regulator n=1 Tax=Actinoplanes missouriensis (strain ATCC 14538 / DSM 43046 / CBS 188.64 / JCM 3121 / NBRC 102363 / NCIMB 12654 / NRRL B-3342 / UNCC 431) TaxID=512565 RepID=I0H4K0_ACTM4|nr:AraC family transcriptional regulator [Actinoplanes missouriensis]BAL87937.1 putative AraC-family transcriptional regulator [Actinoplanes missouriensis 431]
METIGKVHADGPISSASVQSWGNALIASLLADAVWFPLESGTFTGRLHRYPLADVSVINLEAGPFGTRWGRDSPAAHYIGVSVNTREFTERVTFGDFSEHLICQQMDVWDGALVSQAEVLTPMAQITALIPKRALPLRGADTAALMGEISENPTHPSLQILKSLLLGISAEADRLNAAAAAASRNAVVELLISVLETRRPRSSLAVNDGMRLSIGQWVDDRLSLGSPSPAEAADAHGISVRSLHRLYTGTGETFGSMVRRRRLERALHDVVATDDMVQTIAMRWGYADASQFISDFKRMLGVTPSAYRRAKGRRWSAAGA